MSLTRDTYPLTRESTLFLRGAGSDLVDWLRMIDSPFLVLRSKPQHVNNGFKAMESVLVNLE